MKTVVVRTFNTKLEAEVARGMLEANEVRAFILADNEDGEGGFAYGGFRLIIREEQIEMAIELLEETNNK